MNERQTDWIAAAALFVGACTLGLALASVRGTWTDEAATIFAVQKKLPELFRTITEHDANPFGGYLILWLWRQLGSSPEHLRALSALFFGAATALTFMLGVRLRSRVTGLTAALFFMLAPLAQFYSAQARYPMLLTALLLGATLALHELAIKGTRGAAVAYGLLAAAAMYVHYYAAFVLAAHATYLLVERRELANARRTVFAIALAALLFAPWLPVLLRQLIGREASGGGEAVGFVNLLPLVAVYLTQGFTFWKLPSFWNGLLGISWPALPLLLTLPFVVLTALGALAKQGEACDRRLLVIVGLIPLSMFLAASLVLDIFAPHYFLPFLSYLAVLAACGLVRLWQRRRNVALTLGAAMFIVTAGGAIEFYQTPDAPENWRPLASAIAAGALEGDAVLLPNLAARLCYETYKTDELDVYHVTMVRPGVQVIAPEMIDELLPMLRKRYRRLWTVQYYPPRFDPKNALLSALSKWGAATPLHRMHFDERVSLSLWYLFSPFETGGMTERISFPDGPQHPMQLGEGWYESGGSQWWTAGEAMAFLPPANGAKFFIDANVPLKLFGSTPPRVTISLNAKPLPITIADDGRVLIGECEALALDEWTAVKIACDRTFVPDEIFHDGDKIAKCLLVDSLGWGRP